MNLEQLKQKTGDGTELVTLVLPHNYNIDEAKSLIAEERSEAENIKDKSTRKSVQAALKKTGYRLKELDGMPENGVAIFASSNGCWHVQPENKLEEKLYRCDNRFHVEPVERLQGFQSRYGVVVADRNSYVIGEATPSLETSNLHTGTSNIPSKHSKGGQSAQRYERFRETRKKNYVSEIVDRVEKEFLDDIRSGDVLGVVVSGQLNKDIIEALNNEVSSSVVARSNISQGVLQAVRSVEDNLKEKEVIERVKLSRRFLNRLRSDEHRVEYGREHVRKAAELGAVESLMVERGEYV